MWAPGTYLPDRGEGEAVHANIGVEKYFFEAGERILNRIKEYRNTVILPERTGPIADVLYSRGRQQRRRALVQPRRHRVQLRDGADLYFTTMQGAAAAGATGIRISTNTGGFAYLKPGDIARASASAGDTRRGGRSRT